MQGRELRIPVDWGRDRDSGEEQLPDPDPTATPEYATHLERQLHFYTEAARRLGYDGSRVSWARVAGPEV